MRAILLLVLIAIVLSEARAQPCSEIKGVVRDSEHHSLPGANIYLQSNWRVGTSTDTLGRFILPINQPDTVVVSFIGYREQFIPVSTSTCELIITLEATSTQTQEVVVVAERLIAEEFRTFKATKLQIYTNPAARADPLLAVNAMPSSTTLDESANISLRGSTAQETGIYLNNVPIYDGVRYSQLNGIGTFSIFNTAIINNVQVFPGNPPLEYGNASAGLIALQTETNLPEKNSGQATITLANIGINTQLRINSKSALILFSNYQFSDLLTELNKKAFKRISKFNTTDLGLHYFHTWKPNTSLRIFNYSLNESFIYDFIHPSYQGDFRAGKIRNFTTLSVQHRIGNGEFSINQGASFGKSEFAYSLSDIRINDLDLFSSLNYHHTSRWIDFKTGFSYDSRKQKFAGLIPILDYALGTGHPHIHAESTARIPLTEWYGYSKLTLSEKWIAGLGLRKNFPTDHQPHYTSMQANLKWQPIEKVSWLMSVGRYYKIDFARSGETPTIQFENQQASSDLSFKTKRFELTLSAFAKRTQTPINRQYTKGLELFALYKKPKVTAQISFTTLQARIKTGDMSYRSSYDLGYFAKGNFQYRFNQSWSLSAFALWRQGAWYQPVVSSVFNSQWNVYEPALAAHNQQERMPDYFSLSGNLSKMFALTEKLTLIGFLSAENITNHFNLRAYTYNFDYSSAIAERFTQRTFFLGAVLNF